MKDMAVNDFVEQNIKFRDYDIELEPIVSLDFNNPLIDAIIGQEQPVVIKNSGVVDSVLKWNLDYLEERLGTRLLTVYSSPTHNFKYYDLGKASEHDIAFEPPHTSHEMNIKEFAKAFREWRPGKERLYLQNALYSEGVDPQILKDFKNIQWSWLLKQQQHHNWGPLTSNLLLISHPGCLTPVHYDEQQNIFAQIHGYKRFLLFPPKMMKSLYPHPVWHPHDRQSQVDFDAPDLRKFPRFRELKGFSAILGPGDLLYLPNYWWHHVETATGGPDQCVSVNFWYQASQIKEITHPLKDSAKVTLCRNMEKAFITALGDVEEAKDLLTTMVMGRYYYGDSASSTDPAPEQS